ncbi:unnamed protein product [Rotaria sp. Silwood2]|nr:unnamed protein product [Rotaria sp. Silwood2]CAF2541189.1 unnamed protein product [Rotaria sp. Silwood2]CAF2792936.1 unnamed protein product [Rotaria sp. Silwood2]CAF2920955.1 unnamed protein product [Rotaria sp. Silwood2]CAF4255143.1 unnamed protein product [Rotaria sp. Silwood2]
MSLSSSPRSSTITTLSSITFPLIIDAGSSSRTKQYTFKRIKFLLKQQSSTYAVIKHEKANICLCCEVFGFPTKNSRNTGEFEKIKGFESCHIYYRTFIYTSTTVVEICLLIYVLIIYSMQLDE